MDEPQNEQQPDETAREPDQDAPQSAPPPEEPSTDESPPEGAPASGASAEGEAAGPPPPPPPPPGVGAAEPSAMPPEMQAENASTDDRSMAMIAHLLGLVGFLGPLILYLVKKDESSEYVRFHMKQSMWFQIWANVAAFVLGIVSIPLMYVCIGFLTLLLAMAVVVGAWVYAIVGAVQTNGGKDFEYLWVGPWVRQSMV